MDSVQSKTAELASSLGKWSRWLRKQGRPSDRAKRSQLEIAKAAGISRATLSALESGAKESGKPNPQLSVLVGLADAFQVEVRDLMWLAEAPFDEGLGVPSAVKRVAEALGISEMAVDAQRKRLAEPEKAASDLERGAPVPSLRLSPPTELVARDGEQMLQVVRAIVREFAPLAEEATQALHRIDARLGQLAGGESEEL